MTTVTSTHSKTLTVLVPQTQVAKTTKIVVGIDSAKGYVPAIDLLARLKLQKPFATLLHAVDTRCPLENADAHVQAEYAKVVENIGLRSLDASVDEACGRDIKAKTKLVFSPVADAIMRESEESGADLIAIRALKHGAWASGYLGSATCALAINSSKSLLVAKKPIEHSHPLRIVLAVDHSSQTAGLVWRFLQLAPAGIAEILVLTSYEINDETARAANRNLPALGADVDRWLSESLAEKNDRLVGVLAEHGYQAKSSVIKEPADDAIRVAMQGFRADLLIIGALGNGSSAGAKIGSIALHEITAEPYSVLMLR
jgi:nucleotide-binding universal stress UspA family protein